MDGSRMRCLRSVRCDGNEMNANVYDVGALQRPPCASPDGPDGEAVREVLSLSLSGTNGVESSKRGRRCAASTTAFELAAANGMFC